MEGEDRNRQAGQAFDVSEPVFESAFVEGLEFVVGKLHGRLSRRKDAAEFAGSRWISCFLSGNKEPSDKTATFLNKEE